MTALRMAAVLLAFAGAARAAGEAETTLHGVVPPAIAMLASDGPAPAALAVPHVVVWLGLRDRATLRAVIAAQHDPRSPRFGRWLDATEIADRFGARRARYEEARTWLAAQGLRVVGDSPFRTSISVAGDVGRIERALRTRIGMFRRDGRRHRAPTVAPVVPERLGIRGLVGLDDLPAIRPLVALGDGTATLGPADVARAYAVDALHARGLRGAGSTIAILGRSDFDPGDVATFGTRFGVAPRPAVKHFVDGNPGVLPEIGELTEVLLDTQWAGALAPDAQVTVVIGSREGDIPQALGAAVDRRIGQVVSISFGLCEQLTSATVTELFDGLYAVANLQGQTVVVASGDAGATDCSPDLPDLAVNALASSPHAIAIGGTALDPGFDAEGNATGYVAETVWNDVGGAGGGGVSRLFARPGYQLGIGPFAARALPDVSLPASPVSPGYAIVERGDTIVVGGTSAGAPVMAGMLALANQVAGRDGLGQLLPTLYRLGHDGGVFNDVVAGSNGWEATPGFDLASGWGSPIADRLADAIAAAPPGRCEPGLDCLVPAPGDVRHACLGQWLVEHATPRRTARGIPSRRQTCRDGDPACDVDGRADGVCTVNVALCLNVFDVRTLRPRDGLPRCATGQIRAVRLLRPGAGDRVAARGRAAADLAGAVRALPPLPSMLDGACTARVPVAVPVDAGRATGRLTLRARVRGSGRSARPSVTLVCEGSS